MKIWQELKNEMRPKVRYWLPAAAMTEEDLRTEIRAIRDRGFGGVELVVLSMLPPNLARSEDGWGTPNWDHMVDVAADETRKLGMTMDIAIGPGWPIASKVIRSADDPAAIHELTFGEFSVHHAYRGPLPQRRKQHEEGTPELIAAFAYEETADHVLRKDSYIDLMSQAENASLSFVPPYEAVWKIFAFYIQPAVHKINDKQTYVIDHHSEEGACAVEKYWDQVFESRKPYESLESFFCDSLEYEVSMDWTRDLPEEFEKRRGYSILPYLPFIGQEGVFPAIDPPGYRLEDPCESQRIHNDYVETLTQLYCERHLAALEKVAEKYGKTIRYQVAYNKMLEVERSPLYVAIPENEALGRPSIDYMKTMAAAAHLGRKKRYSFECAAEFGHSYGQNYEDLFWWIKRAAMAGMNAQVLHGASYSGGYRGALSENGNLPLTQWPGYEGFGKFVSNYWNRTLSVEDARGCLDTVTRMNTIFRQKARVDVLIYREDLLSHGLGSEFCLYDDGGVLSNHGYSYEFASEAVLAHPNCVVKNGILDAEGTAYRCLLVPGQEMMSISMLNRIKELTEAGLTVFWIDGLPEGRKFFAESEKDWQQALENVRNLPILSRSEVPAELKRRGIDPRVRLNGKKDLMTMTREDESGTTYYILYAYNRLVLDQNSPNPDEISVSAIYRKGTIKRSYERPGLVSRETIEVTLEGTGNVYLLEPFSGSITPLAFDEENGCMKGTLEIEEDEMIFLMLSKEEDRAFVRPFHKTASYPVNFRSVAFSSFEPDDPEETSFLRSHFEPYGPRKAITDLVSWPEWGKDRFGGRALYEAEIHLDRIDPEARYVLESGHVEDTFHVWINNKKAPFPDQVMKRVDVTGLLVAGINEVKIEVTSDLYNRLFTADAIPFAKLPVLTRPYGITETAGKKIRLIKYAADRSL